MSLSQSLEAAAAAVGLDRLGATLSQQLHQAVLDGGKPARAVADALHGTWLGHPLHPLLTDVTIGAWLSGAVLDAYWAWSGDDRAAWGADVLTTLGTASAVPTALAGLADYSTTQKPAKTMATVHAAANDVALGLYVWSVRERRRGNRSRGVTLSALGFAVSGLGAWIGGHLSYRQQVGVDHSRAADWPEDWTAVADSADVPAGTPTSVDVEGHPVLLLRTNGALHAVGGTCSHAGGPLPDGDVDCTGGDCVVQCPWHDAVFDLRSGHVVHGPATHPLPAFDARERGGRVEIRLRRN